MAARRRTAAQTAASKRNLEKARAARKKGVWRQGGLDASGIAGLKRQISALRQAKQMAPGSGSSVKARDAKVNAQIRELQAQVRAGSKPSRNAGRKVNLKAGVGRTRAGSGLPSGTLKSDWAKEVAGAKKRIAKGDYFKQSKKRK
jgi:hypothetical protein